MKYAMIALFLAAGTAQATTNLRGFDEIREACKDPAKFQNQIAPKNLQVTCEDRSTKWVSASASTIELARTREVISSLSSDKYTVEATSTYIPMDNQRVACPRFKEVLEEVTFTKATTCEEILEFEGTEAEFCTDILDRVRQSNPKSIKVTDTGSEVDLCAAKEEERCDRGQRGQRNRCDK